MIFESTWCAFSLFPASPVFRIEPAILEEHFNSLLKLAAAVPEATSVIPVIVSSDCGLPRKGPPIFADIDRVERLRTVVTFLADHRKRHPDEPLELVRALLSLAHSAGRLSARRPPG